MKNALRVSVLSFLVFFAGFSAKAYAAPDEAVASRIVKIDGANLHYLTAGHGPALVLLHGYAETSLMWKPIIPSLAQRLRKPPRQRQVVEFLEDRAVFLEQIVW